MLVAPATLAACPTPPPPAPVPPPPPPGTVVDFEVHGPVPTDPVAGEHGGTPTTPGTPDRTRPQSPDIKLKLGHYTNARHQIGLVIDRTNKEARVRFDHVPQLLKLDPIRGSGRIDYVRTINEVVLQVYDSGRVVVFVPNTRESIDVTRDGDADPL
jgi:hypothetical protein